MTEQERPMVRHPAFPAVTFALMAAVVGAFTIRGNAAPPPGQKAPPQQLFQNWPGDRKPDLAIVLSGEQHSYLKFCGCSVPQLGGYERRANFIESLKARGWSVVAFDLGDLLQRKPGDVHEQTLLKYATAMKSLEAIGYSVIGVGANEFNLPLLEGLSRFTLQKPDARPRVLSANLLDREQNFPLDEKRSMVGADEIVGGDGLPKVGVVSVVGPSTRREIQDPDIKFDDTAKVLSAAQDAFDRGGAELRVLLYQGLPVEAKAAAERFPRFQLILCRSPEEEPAARPFVIGQTMICAVGHRGRYVGVVGVYRTGNPAKPFELHYQLVAMSDEFETPPDREAGHRILELLQKYAEQVRDQEFLKRYPKTPHPKQTAFPDQNVRFVGSETCARCHAQEYKIWKDSKHAHAFEALENYATKPTLRQFDGECVICHTVGFQFVGGYSDDKATPHLKGVGCENCHGPGSLHAADPNNKTYLALQSPWKADPTERLTDARGEFNKVVLNRVDASCQKCHDTENDPKYRFEQYWPKINHSRQVAQAAAVQPAK